MKFQPLAISINRIYAILKIAPKFTMSQAAHSKANYCKKFQPFSTVNIKYLIGFRSNSFFYRKKEFDSKGFKKGIFWTLLFSLQNRHNFFSKRLNFRVSRSSYGESFSIDVLLIAPVIAIAVLYWRDSRLWWHDFLEDRRLRHHNLT